MLFDFHIKSRLGENAYFGLKHSGNKYIYDDGEDAFSENKLFLKTPQSTGDCVVYKKTDGFLERVDCMNKESFICETPAASKKIKQIFSYYF